MSETGDFKASLDAANAAYKAQDYKTAEANFRRAIEQIEAIFGDGHPDIAYCLQSLGLIYSAFGDFPKAVSAYERLVTIGTQVLGENSPRLYGPMTSLITAYRNSGRTAEADALQARLSTLAQPQVTTGPQPTLPLRASQEISVSQLPPEIAAQLEAAASGQPTSLPPEIEAQLNAAMSGLPPAVPPDIEAQLNAALPPDVAAQLNQGPTHTRSTQEQTLPPDAMRNSQQFSAPGAGPQPRPFQEQTIPPQSMRASQQMSAPQGMSASQQMSAPQGRSVQEQSYPPQHPRSTQEQTLSPEQVRNSQQMNVPPLSRRQQSQSQPQEVSDDDDLSTSQTMRATGEHSSPQPKSSRYSARVDSVSMPAPGVKHRASGKSAGGGKIAPPQILIAVVTLLVIGAVAILFIVQSKMFTSQPALSGLSNETFQTADGLREIKLTTTGAAEILTAGNTAQADYIKLSGSTRDLVAMLPFALAKKEVWFRQTEQGLIDPAPPTPAAVTEGTSTSGGVVSEHAILYTPGTPESKTIERMKELASFAQKYYKQNNAYPSDAKVWVKEEKISLADPSTKKVDSPSFHSYPSSKDSGMKVGSDGKVMYFADFLRSGRKWADEPGVMHANSVQCCGLYIQGQSEQARRINDFYIHGCDRNGNLLSGSTPGKVYLIRLSNGRDLTASENANAIPSHARMAPAKIVVTTSGDTSMGRFMLHYGLCVLGGIVTLLMLVLWMTDRQREDSRSGSPYSRILMLLTVFFGMLTGVLAVYQSLP